jgi:hypothetical protein
VTHATVFRIRIQGERVVKTVKNVIVNVSWGFMYFIMKVSRIKKFTANTVYYSNDVYNNVVQ